MKKTYNKPVLKSVRLWAAEQLMVISGGNSLGLNEESHGGTEAYSNQEGAHDIWGNEGNGIW